MWFVRYVHKVDTQFMVLSWYIPCISRDYSLPHDGLVCVMHGPYIYTCIDWKIMNYIVNETKIIPVQLLYNSTVVILVSFTIMGMIFVYLQFLFRRVKIVTLR